MQENSMLDRVRLRNTHAFDTNLILLDVFRLLSMIHADRSAKRSVATGKTDPLHVLQERFFHTEASRLLLSISVQVRVLQDVATSSGKQGLPISRFPADEAVGELWWHTESARRRNGKLNVRDACNKIIHASEFQWRVSLTEELTTPRLSGELATLSGDMVLSPHWSNAQVLPYKHMDASLLLRGKEGDRGEWFAVLNVDDFSHALITGLRSDIETAVEPDM